MSPKYAAAERAERDAARARCTVQKDAIRAEARSVLLRDVSAVRAELDAANTKLEIAHDLAINAERDAAAAQFEAGSKWSTMEVVGFIAGGIALGAIVGGVSVYYLNR
tara:strand:- start:568 stop:891 length:324 start_codon:yes stop_codon:yes gene_type:complete